MPATEPDVPATEPDVPATEPDVGADAGSDVPVDPCGSPTGWSPEAWEPRAASDIAEKLQAVQAAMPGQWHGEVKVPWLSTPQLVDLTFRADGTYSGRCSNASCCVAFGAGTDDDTPLERYRVEDATLSGNVLGELDIAFVYDDGYELANWHGILQHIETDASGNGLRFTFQTKPDREPLVYDLRRVTAP